MTKKILDEYKCYRLIGIIFEKNTLELTGSNNKRYYYKVPSNINAQKSFTIGETLVLKDGHLYKKPTST